MNTADLELPSKIDKSHIRFCLSTDSRGSSAKFANDNGLETWSQFYALRFIQKPRKLCEGWKCRGINSNFLLGRLKIWGFIETGKKVVSKGSQFFRQYGKVPMKERLVKVVESKSIAFWVDLQAEISNYREILSFFPSCTSDFLL
jgi:hypothetical protein